MTDPNKVNITMPAGALSETLVWSYKEGYATAIKVLTGAQPHVVNDDTIQKMTEMVVKLKEKYNG